MSVDRAPIRRGPLKAALCLAIGLAAGSCATSTPYQPKIAGQAVHGGYSERRLGEGRYLMTFDGNTLTSRERVEGYMLYRAAELAVQNDYDWFRIVQRATDTDERTYVEPNYHPWYGYGHWRPYWRYYRPHRGWGSWYPYGRDPFWADRYDVQTVREFEAHAEVVMGHGPLPPGDGDLFDARKVMADLGPSIERPKQ